MTEAQERLTEWSQDVLHVVRSVRTHEPTYANPAALRADVRSLLAALEAAEADARQAEGLLKIASAEDLLYAAQCLDGSVRVYEEGNAPETAGMVRRSAAAVRALAALGRA